MNLLLASASPVVSLCIHLAACCHSPTLIPVAFIPKTNVSLPQQQTPTVFHPHASYFFRVLILLPLATLRPIPVAFVRQTNVYLPPQQIPSISTPPASHWSLVSRFNCLLQLSTPLFLRFMFLFRLSGCFSSPCIPLPSCISILLSVVTFHLIPGAFIPKTNVMLQCCRR